MSYDLMVFEPTVIPETRTAFMSWYYEQTQWSEDHNYDDPAVSSGNLKSWFMEMIDSFPAMNGPYSREEDEDNEFVTDYSIGKDVIYAAFSWSVAEQAYEKMKSLAEIHKVGFFDASADEGEILVPDGIGNNRPIDRPGNFSSIQQIKKSASPGMEDHSVADIIYSRVLPQILEGSKRQLTPKKDSRSWWKRLLGLR